MTDATSSRPRLPWFALILQALTVIALGALIGLELGAHNDAQQHADGLRGLLLEPRYEYKLITTLAAPPPERTGADALEVASITPDERELSRLGGQGWDVVASYLELETAYPNFGDRKYVTGLQPNIRPQRLVIVLRHRLG
ncbi:MAG TPA: hypothetical protein VGC42_23690 [Kofleriaceae bacterium]